MKWLRAFLLTGLAILLFAGGYFAGTQHDLAPVRAIAADDCQMFTQTNHQVCGVFLQYWTDHGGLAQQGYPISDPLMEMSATDGKTYQVQYFERAVFEMHPELQAPNNVLLSLLGSEKFKAKYTSPTATATTAPTTGPTNAATATADLKATTLAQAGIPYTPTPTAAATAITATSTTAAGTLPVSITNITSPIVHGSNATATVKTTPGAACSIDVEYATGGSKAAGLVDKTAAANGVVGWTWTVESRTAPGSWAVTVTCKAAGMIGTIQTTLQVT